MGLGKVGVRVEYAVFAAEYLEETNMLKINLKGALLTTAALAISAVPALAQLDEIVVTAEKRTTNLQDTPIAITAISEETLSLQQVTNVNDISSLAPNLNIKPGTTNKNASVISIRGIGISGEEMMTQDVPTGFYVDGVLVSKSAATSIELADIEQVEILRGPQGTLFGRNSIGGSVNFKTKRPGDEVGGNVEVGLGNFGYQTINAKINLGKITDRLKASVAIGRSERDGVIDNLLQGDDKDPGAYETLSGRIALEMDVSDTVNAYYTYDFSNSDSYGQYYQTTVADGFHAFGLSQLNANAQAGCPDFTVQRSRQEDVCIPNIGESENETEGHMLQVDIDLGGMTLRSITGYRDWYFTNGVIDIGGFGPIPGALRLGVPATVGASQYAATSVRNHNQLTQEFTLISAPGDTIDWVAGVFYLDEEGDETGMQYIWLPFGIPANQIPANSIIPSPSPDFDMSAKSQAIYGQLTYHATPKLNVTVGGRYTRDEMDVTQTLPATAAGSRSTDSSEPTGHITLDYAYSDTVNTYAKISRGYRAGGFAARGTGDAFDPETATAFELGMKSQSSDNRIRFNAAVFTTEYKDRQVTQPVGSQGAFVNRIVNASEQNIEGIELELQAQLTDKLTVEAAYGYTKVETDGYFHVVNNVLTDISDNLAHAQPENTANVAVTYRDTTSMGDLTARLGATYASDSYSFVNPFSETHLFDIGTDAHTLVNGQIRIDNVWGSAAYVMLWGKNLTDEEYLARGIDFQALGHAGGYWNDPRTFGINVGYKF